MKPKIMTMCQGGNVRSVALGYLLKYKYGCDAIACGWEGNTPATVSMLAHWADRVFVLEEKFKAYIPEAFHPKLVVVDVGPDRWGASLHPELLEIIDSGLSQIFTQKPVPVEAEG